MEEKGVLALTEEEFDAEALSSEIPVMVDFWAPWCGPCRMVAPIMEQLSREYQGRAKLCKVNVDEEGALAARFGVMSIPCVFVFKNGEIFEQAIGAYPKAHFADMLDRAM